MATKSRHTEAITDAYLTGLRMRNEARAKCATEQLGTVWLLHPDNNVTAEEHSELRRARSERINTRAVRTDTFATPPGRTVLIGLGLLALAECFELSPALLTIEHGGGK